MNKFVLGFLILGLTVLFIFFGTFVVKDVGQNSSIQKIKIGEKDYELEVVKSPEDLERGLSKFESISDNQGMLFIFDTPGRWNIWMKDMKFNIDIIFLNEKNEVVTLFKNVKFETHENVYQYRRYQPDFDSKYIIELKEGEIEKNKIKIGDKINF